MQHLPPTQYIQLDRVLQIARGDQAVLVRYLALFLELVEQRMQRARQLLDADDRAGVQRVMHSMGPQLEYFGMMDTVATIRALKDVSVTASSEVLEGQVATIEAELGEACAEVRRVLASLH